MTDATTLSSLHYFVEQTRWVSPCIEVVALTNEALPDSAAAYQHAYQSFARRWGSQLTWWRTNAMKQMRPWDTRAAGMLPFWMQDEVSLAQAMIGLTAQAGQPKPACAPPMLSFYHEQVEAPRGGIQFSLPADTANSPEALLTFVQEALADFPLSFGYAGFALCWHPDSYDTQRVMRENAPRWLLRYPGLGLGDLLPFALTSQLGLLNVSWLTLLGTDARARLEELQPDTAWPVGARLYDLPSGALMVQAAPQPELGDVNRADRLEAYGAVAQALGPLWAADDVIEQINLMVLQDDTKTRWLKRFLETTP